MINKWKKLKMSGPTPNKELLKCIILQKERIA